MRKIDKILGLGFLVTLLALSCRKIDLPTPINQIPSELAISSVSGICLPMIPTDKFDEDSTSFEKSI